MAMNRALFPKVVKQPGRSKKAAKPKRGKKRSY